MKKVLTLSIFLISSFYVQASEKTGLELNSSRRILGLSNDTTITEDAIDSNYSKPSMSFDVSNVETYKDQETFYFTDCIKAVTEANAAWLAHQGMTKKEGELFFARLILISTRTGELDVKGLNLL